MLADMVTRGRVTSIAGLRRSLRFIDMVVPALSSRGPDLTEWEQRASRDRIGFACPHRA